MQRATKYSFSHIDTAGGGKESVELAGKNKYDVILMDQRMPEMDGEEAFYRTILEFLPEED
ncbi:MAG TPA: hypothetical protein DEO39_06685 [Clostridiales bacterium]|nr:hypothetical protein [Clostridiales bacterium]